MYLWITDNQNIEQSTRNKKHKILSIEKPTNDKNLEFTTKYTSNDGKAKILVF